MPIDGQRGDRPAVARWRSKTTNSRRRQAFQTPHKKSLHFIQCVIKMMVPCCSVVSKPSYIFFFRRSKPKGAEKLDRVT